MTSVGCQADISDSEGILGVVCSFRNQLAEIQQVNQALLGNRLLHKRLFCNKALYRSKKRKRKNLGSKPGLF